MPLQPEATTVITTHTETSRLHDLVTAGKRFLGRTALALSMALGPGIAVGAAETMLDPHPLAAHADTTFTNDYPDLGAQVYNQATYDWWVDENNNGVANVTPSPTDNDETMSSRGYGYRNCTDGVAYWVGKYTGKSVSGWGNAKDWSTKAPSDQVYPGSTTSIEPGDIAQSDDGTYGHVGFITSVAKNADGSVQSFTAAELNKAGTGDYTLTTYNTKNGAGNFVRTGNYDWDHIIDVNGPGQGLNNEPIGGGGSTPPPPTHLSRMLFVRGDDMLFAKDSFGNAWSDETGAGWVRSNAATQVGTIAVGGADGATQLWINSCNALYAKTNLGQGGWTEEAACNTAKSVSVSSTNLQMMVGTNGAVWAKYGVGVAGWTYEAASGTGAAVAAGGDTQMMLGACGAVYAKNGVGYGGWTEEAPCGTATEIAISSTGLQMMRNACGAFYSKYGVGVGGWWAEGDCGWAKQIAAGGDTHMFLSTNGGVYAKTSMGYGGWTEEAPSGTANAIAIGNNGRQVMITSDSSIFAKDGISVGGWAIQAGPGNGKAIAVS